jgi:UDP-glucose:(heptosyl)LPS alpha-1,3-glucosyltransferase
MRLAEICLARGHSIKVFTGSWEGEVPDELDVILLPPRGLTNHRKAEIFSKTLMKQPFIASCDAVIGFNKMPGLDIYFASDSCFAAKAASKSFLYRGTPRCRIFLKLEMSVFGGSSSTEILLLSENEKKHFVRYYGTTDNRFHLLPPGISKDRLPSPGALEKGRQLRSELGIGPDLKVVLMLGSGFKTKGLDRAILAVRSLPDKILEKTILLIVGQDNARPFKRMARRLGIESNIKFTGGRDDVPRVLWAADLLIHPAYRENTGTVLIEAMAAGLPVLTTDVCGYSHYVEKAKAGILIPSPYNQSDLDQQLAMMLASFTHQRWGENGKKFVMENDVFSLHEKAADIIDEVAR